MIICVLINPGILRKFLMAQSHPQYICAWNPPNSESLQHAAGNYPKKYQKLCTTCLMHIFQQFSYKNDNSRSSKNLRKWKSVLLLHAKVFCPVTIDVQWLHKKSISRYTSAITSLNGSIKFKEHDIHTWYT